MSAGNFAQFDARLRDLAGKVEQNSRDTFTSCQVEVQRSVVEGSEITGAPGQPRDTGNLAGSWIPEQEEAWKWHTATGVDYAPHVEDNVRGVTFKNHGPHSVARTIAGWGRIVDAVRKRILA